MPELAKFRPWARLVLTVGVTGATFLTLGLVGAEYVRSPAEVAAETAAPDPSKITVPVERRQLRQTIQVSATIPEMAAATPSTDGDHSPVVTGTPRAAGDEVAEGDVVVELSGRPLLALRGRFAFYRDMSVGDSGPDVRQLQEALARLGHYAGAIDGKFGPQVSSAVAAWYHTAGYDAPTPGQDQDSPNGAAPDVGLPVMQARTALDQARRELDAARTDEGRIDEEAAAMLAAAQAAHDAVMSDDESTEQQRRDAELQLKRAKHESERLRDAATERVRLAHEQVTIASAALSQASEDAAEAERQADLARHSSMPMVSVAEITVLDELPAAVVSVEPIGTRLEEQPAARLWTGTSLEVELTAAQTRLVQPGQAVAVIGTATEGTVASVRDRADGAEAEGGGGVAVIELAAGTPDTQGSRLGVEIVIAETDGEVSAVPITAIRDLPDGRTAVMLAADGADVEIVEVEVGLHANGWVQVSARGSQTLDADSRVVVSEARATTGSHHER